MFNYPQGLGEWNGRARRMCFRNVEEAACQAQKQQPASVSHDRRLREGAIPHTLPGAVSPSPRPRALPPPASGRSVYTSADRWLTQF